MENIDESKRKPRRTRGTPSFHYRNRFAYAFIAGGSVLFALWACTPIFRKANERMCESLLTPTEEEIDRRFLFTMPKARTRRAIEQSIEEERDLMSSR